MNDEPKRLVDEDPNGAAGLLLRAALEQGPPPPLEAKKRVAKELGIDGATVTAMKPRRMALWALSSGIAAAAAFAIWMIIPGQTPHETYPAAEMVPTPAATATQAVPAAQEPAAAPPAPTPATPMPMATSYVNPRIIPSADAGAKGPIKRTPLPKPIKF